MFVLLCLLCFCVVHGHTGASDVQVDGDMQSELMPQELNPAFIGGKDVPWKAEISIDRNRRNTDLAPPVYTTCDKIKFVTRIVASVVLTLSAIGEIVIYFLEMYYTV